MSQPNLKSLRLSERDLDFLVETTHPEATDKLKLKQIIREDEGFRNTFIGEKKVFRRLMDDEEIFLKISPALFFEILLRKIADDLKEVSFTVEKTGTAKIPVFDTKDVLELLTKESLLLYLSECQSEAETLVLKHFSNLSNLKLYYRIRIKMGQEF